MHPTRVILAPDVIWNFYAAHGTHHQWNQLWCLIYVFNILGCKKFVKMSCISSLYHKWIEYKINEYCLDIVMLACFKIILWALMWRGKTSTTFKLSNFWHNVCVIFLEYSKVESTARMWLTHAWRTQIRATWTHIMFLTLRSLCTHKQRVEIFYGFLLGFRKLPGRGLH